MLKETMVTCAACKFYPTSKILSKNVTGLEVFDTIQGGSNVLSHRSFF